MKITNMVSSAIILLGFTQIVFGDQIEEVRCGSYCLTVALKSLGSNVTLEQVESKIGEPGQLGYSLSQLESVANDSGFETALVQTNVEQLKYRKNALGEVFACLTLVKNKHFVLLYDVADVKVEICDPPSLKTQDLIVFDQIWSGKALLISTKKMISEEELYSRRKQAYFKTGSFLIMGLIAAIFLSVIFSKKRLQKLNTIKKIFTTLLLPFALSGCQTKSHSDQQIVIENSGTITVEPESHDLGRLIGGIGKTIDVETTIKNVGEKNLEIKRIIASCDCTNAKISKNILLPGQTATLSTEIKIGDLPENRISRIEIESSDKEKPEKSIFFKWYVENPLRTSQQSYTLVELPTGFEKRLTIPVTGKYLSFCADCSFQVEEGDELFHAIWTPKAFAISKNHQENLRDESELAVGDINIKFKPKRDDYSFDRVIRLTLSCSNEIRARLSIPITWSFQRPIVVTPTRLSIGIVKRGDQISKEIYLRSSHNLKFRIRSITLNDNTVPFDSKYNKEIVNEAFVTINLKLPNKSGTWRDYITIQTDIPGADSLVVPISCLIDD